MLEACGISYRYPGSPEGKEILAGLDLELHPGEVVCLVGPNGSGKSTIARLLDGLLLPCEGRVLVDGMDTSIGDNCWFARRMVGLVGPDPDSQLVATLVEEETAFGPANLNLPLEEVNLRVERALSLVGIEGLIGRTVQSLSAGQKQKVVLAATLAMEPHYLVLDEAVAMLEPGTRKAIMAICRQLADSLGLGVLIITHSGEEFMITDRVLVMGEGKIAAEYARSEILSHRKDLHRLGWPAEGDMVLRLIRAGYPLPSSLQTVKEAGEVLCSLS